MREIGAFEAKNRFGQLLDWVEAGEDVMITRRGKVVARLSPPERTFSAAAAQTAAQNLRARRRGVTLGGAKLENLISEGRR